MVLIKKSSDIMRNYLSNHCQRTKINTTFSSWSGLLIKGVPQGSFLGPILFNIDLNDLFFVLKDTVCNPEDDTSPH